MRRFVTKIVNPVAWRFCGHGARKVFHLALAGSDEAERAPSCGGVRWMNIGGARSDEALLAKPFPADLYQAVGRGKLRRARGKTREVYAREIEWLYDRDRGAALAVERVRS